MKVLKNTTAYMVAGLLPNVVNFFMLPVYTRLLDPSDYGLVSLVGTLMSFLTTIMGLHLFNSIPRLFFDYEGPDVKTYISTILFGMLGINAAIIVLYHVMGPSLTHLLFPRGNLSYHPYVMLGLVVLFFNGIVHFCNALLRVRERGGMLLMGGAVYALSGVLFAVYFVVYRRMGACGVLAAQACNAVVRSLFLLFVVRKDIGLRFSSSVLRAALRFSLPIIPHSLGGVLFMYTDKYILSFYVPLAAIGIYDLAGKLSNVLRLIVASFHAAISPSFMKSSRDDKSRTVESYRGVISRWSAIVAILFLGLSLFSREIIWLLAPAKYHSAYVYVPVLAGGMLFRSMQGFAVNAIMFEKRTRVIPIITATAGLLNVGLNLVLIPTFGALAAAWTTLVAYGWAFGLALYLSRRCYPMPFDWPRLVRLYGGMLLAFVVAETIPVESYVAMLCIKIVLLLVFLMGVWWSNMGGIADEMRSVLGSLWTKVKLRRGDE
jgi:O-antigen/teichoic acid export membrane protein